MRRTLFVLLLLAAPCFGQAPVTLPDGEYLLTISSLSTPTPSSVAVRFTVKGGAPAPPSPKPPEPPSPPVSPDDPLGLTSLVRERIAAKGWSGPDARLGAAALATLYEAHAAAAASYQSAGAMLDAVDRGTAGVLGEASARSWWTAVVGPVRARACSIATTAEMAAAFLAVAKALRETK